MEILESPQNHPVQQKPLHREPNKNGDFKQPRKIQTFPIELSPDRYQDKLDFTCSKDEHPQLDSKSQKPTRVPQSSQGDAGEDLLPTPGPLTERTAVRPNAPSSEEESNSHQINLNLGSTKGWEPDPSQRLKRKYYNWAAAEAARDRHRGNQNHNQRAGGWAGENQGNGNQARNQQGRPNNISPDIPMHPTEAPSPFDQIAAATLLPAFRPIPGDIVITLECRPIRQNNPYFNPGGHCYLYTDPLWLDMNRGMTPRAQAEENIQAQVGFQPDDLIVRAGQMDTGYHWIPQRNVEVFRHVGTSYAAPWLLYARVPYRPLRPPITYAAGDPTLAHRTVHEFQPGNASRLAGDRVVFRPERGDLLMREDVGFSNMQISYYDPHRTTVESGLLLLRAGYGRVGNSLVATIEMYQYKPHPTTGELGWVFQGRDIQIYGGTQTLDSLVQMMDHPAVSAPRAETTTEENAWADGYLNL